MASHADAIGKALEKRTNAPASRRKRLASAYINASVARAVAVTTATEPPPTAMKSAQLALLIRLLEEFGDVPTPTEIAALLRITRTAANGLLGEVLATSDTASAQLLKGVFSRAQHLGAGNDESPLPRGNYWQFATSADLQLARDRLEFRGVAYRTISSRDGVYQLVVDRDYEPPQ